MLSNAGLPLFNRAVANDSIRCTCDNTQCPPQVQWIDHQKKNNHDRLTASDPFATPSPNFTLLSDAKLGKDDVQQVFDPDRPGDASDLVNGHLWQRTFVWQGPQTKASKSELAGESCGATNETLTQGSSQSTQHQTKPADPVPATPPRPAPVRRQRRERHRGRRPRSRRDGGGALA